MVVFLGRNECMAAGNYWRRWYPYRFGIGFESWSISINVYMYMCMENKIELRNVIDKNIQTN